MNKFVLPFQNKYSFHFYIQSNEYSTKQGECYRYSLSLEIRSFEETDVEVDLLAPIAWYVFLVKEYQDTDGDLIKLELSVLDENIKVLEKSVIDATPIFYRVFKNVSLNKIFKDKVSEYINKYLTENKKNVV